MAKNQKTGGRKAGTPNKTTASVKAVFEAAFIKAGGEDALVAWALDNQTEFYKLYAKLLPVQVNADVKINDALADRLNRVKDKIGSTAVAVASTQDDE